MIILGDRHRFSDGELAALKMHFNAIDHISYRDSESEDVIAQIEQHLDKSHRSTLILNTQASIPDTLLSYLTRLEHRGIHYLTTETFLEHYLHKCYIPEDHTSAAFLEQIRPYSKWQYFFKRAIDFAGAVILGTITSPVMLYAAWRIKKESPSGPVFFKQTRVGKNNHPFTCYKFRSMHEDSHHDPYTQEDDPRIFRWGNTMRRMRIDELPQLWNVLKGEMHLLGPRAEWDILVANYEKEIPYYNQRHVVAPGITGWAQVNYPYGANAEDARQKLMYDLYYIKHWSPWLEIQTAWKTAAVMLGAKGR